MRLVIFQSGLKIEFLIQELKELRVKFIVHTVLN